MHTDLRDLRYSPASWRAAGECIFPADGADQKARRFSGFKKQDCEKVVVAFLLLVQTLKLKCKLIRAISGD